jgi:cardiolipin synthase (CMP-forming)
MNIPNSLTALRLVLVPVFLIIFFSDLPNSFLIAVLVFLAAGLTDILDGYIARKYNMITKWGSILDPLADKLMSLTVLLSLTIKNIIPGWVLLIIGIKEILMIAGAAVMFKRGANISAQVYGKASTALFYVAIIVLEMFSRSLGLILIYATVLTALFSLYKYFENFQAIHKKSC